MKRSPLSSFRGEYLPGIGHNQGPPLEAGHGFRVFAWKKARAELLPKLPLEVLKRRVARAKELGLAYPQYASILLGTGRDVVAFLFTSDAVGMRLERGYIPEDAVTRLTRPLGAGRLLMVPDAAEVDAVRAQLSQRQILLDGLGRAPGLPATPGDGRRAIRSILDPRKLPGDTVVMIGTTQAERDWAHEARLAKFLPSESYFG